MVSRAGREPEKRALLLLPETAQSSPSSPESPTVHAYYRGALTTEHVAGQVPSRDPLRRRNRFALADYTPVRIGDLLRPRYGQMASSGGERTSRARSLPCATDALRTNAEQFPKPNYPGMGGS